MEIEFKQRSSVKATIYGQVVEMKKPTVGQVETMQDEVSKNGAAPVSVMKRFAIELGLPAELAVSMEADHFLELMEHLTGQKKKS